MFKIGNNVFNVGMDFLAKVVESNDSVTKVRIVQGTGKYADMEGQEIAVPTDLLVRARLTKGDAVKVVPHSPSSDANWLNGKVGVIATDSREGSSVGIDFLENLAGGYNTTHNLGGILNINTGWFVQPIDVEIICTPRLKGVYSVGQNVFVSKEVFTYEYGRIAEIEDFLNSHSFPVKATVMKVCNNCLVVDFGAKLFPMLSDCGGLVPSKFGMVVCNNPYFVKPVLETFEEVKDSPFIGLRAFPNYHYDYCLLRAKANNTIVSVHKSDRGRIFYQTPTDFIDSSIAMPVPVYDGTETGDIIALPEGKILPTDSCIYIPAVKSWLEKDYVSKNLFVNDYTGEYDYIGDKVIFIDKDYNEKKTTAETIVQVKAFPFDIVNGKYVFAQNVIEYVDEDCVSHKMLKRNLDISDLAHCEEHNVYYKNNLPMCPVCLRDYGSIDNYCHEQHSCLEDDDAFRMLDSEEEGDFGGLYYGVEVESERNPECRNPRFDRYFIAELRTKFEGVFSCKEDGSLNSSGIEAVTVPCSIRYHLESDLWNNFNSVAKKYARVSHDSTHCGLHVHFSRAPFIEKGIEDYEAEITLAYEKFYPIWKRISRRTLYSSNHYCLFITERDNEDSEKVEWTKKKCKEKMSRDRYLAVNTTNRYTVEIRIFRGTIKADTIKATLWLVNAVNQYILSGKSVDNCSKFKELIGYDSAPEYVKNYLYARGI